MSLIKEAYVSGRTNKFINARLNGIKDFEFTEMYEVILVTDYPKKLVQKLKNDISLRKYDTEAFYSLYSTSNIRVYIIGEKLTKCFENFCWTETDYIFYDLLKKENVILKKAFEKAIEVENVEEVNIKNIETIFTKRYKTEEFYFRKRAKELDSEDSFKFYNVFEVDEKSLQVSKFEVYTLVNLKANFERIVNASLI
ncbi:MAG: hypothetical protein ACRCYT_06895 [Cetobacterium sp.]